MSRTFIFDIETHNVFLKINGQAILIPLDGVGGTLSLTEEIGPGKTRRDVTFHLADFYARSLLENIREALGDMPTPEGK